MIEINSLDACSFRERDEIVAALGSFDGLHLAHQRIIRACNERARERGGMSVLFTFQNHPRTALNPGQPVPLLTPYALKLQWIRRMNVGAAVGIPFDLSFSQIPAEVFIDEILRGKLAAKEIVVGYNFRFGHDREGDAELLLSRVPSQFERVTVVQQQQDHDLTISSTVIRDIIAQGDLKKASDLLGRPYQVAGIVIQGDGRGKSIGLPTANLDVSEQVIPPGGVYGVRVRLDALEAPPLWGVMNVGFVPTFKLNASPRCEVHLLDYDDDLYGRYVIADILLHLRNERKFSGKDELLAQIRQDILQFQKWIAEQTDVSPVVWNDE
ncbi:MAG: riboflavin biosynthesis protein RibF [Candidatus Omnitrophota bacterium]